MVEHLCGCGPAAQLNSPDELRCRLCGRPFVTDEQIHALNDEITATTQGRDGLIPHGNIAEGKGLAPESYVGRRTALIAICSPIIGAILEAGWDVLLKVNPYIKELEENANINARGLTLSFADIILINSALSDFAKLTSLENHFSAQGRTSATLLVQALASHRLGRLPFHAVKILDYLLESEYDNSVTQYLLVRRATILALCGRADQGLHDLDTAIELEKDDKKKVGLLRQAMSHAYITISDNEIDKPSEWHKLHEYLARAKDIMGLPDYTLENWSYSLTTATDFDSCFGTGVLIFDTIVRASGATERGADPLEPLRQHLALLEQLEVHDAWGAWIRYTPLIALAIRVEQLVFAEEALAAAKSYTEPGRMGAAAQYAAQQRSGGGIEWNLHKLSEGTLRLRRSERATGEEREALRNEARLAFMEALRGEPASKVLFGRQAWLYLCKLTEDPSLREKCQAKAFALPARSHWTYVR